MRAQEEARWRLEQLEMLEDEEAEQAQKTRADMVHVAVEQLREHGNQRARQLAALPPDCIAVWGSNPRLAGSRRVEGSLVRAAVMGQGRSTTSPTRSGCRGRSSST